MDSLPVLKLLQLCELPEWDSSTKAGNVTEKIKLDFNDFNSAVFSVYKLHPILNAFIVPLYVNFSKNSSVLYSIKVPNSW